MGVGRTEKSKLRKPRSSAWMGLMIAAVVLLGGSRPAHACFFPVCWNFGCIVLDQGKNMALDAAEEAATIAYLESHHAISFRRDRASSDVSPEPYSGGVLGLPPGSVLYDFANWMIVNYFDNYIGSALESMGQQFTNDITQQTLAIGAFYDAKNQLETQLLYQQLAARAHNDYEPSFGMCVFGTSMKSIGASDFNAQQAAFYLSHHQQARELESANTLAAEGTYSGPVKPSGGIRAPLLQQDR